MKNAQTTPPAATPAAAPPTPSSLPAATPAAAPPTPSSLPAPTRGGCWVRNADGSLSVDAEAHPPEAAQPESLLKAVE